MSAFTCPGRFWRVALVTVRTPAGQVKVVTDAIRAEGAKRVVLVGASMGGSVSLAAAQVTGADAIADLSGPAEFGQFSVTVDAANVT